MSSSSPFFSTPRQLTATRLFKPVLAALLLLLGTLQASAHAPPGALPPVANYDIRWFQSPDNHDIQDWDIEIVPFESASQPRVVQAQPSPETSSCWIAAVPTNEPARVRVRAVQDGQVSAWSAPTAVPEPRFSAGLIIGGFLLSRLRRGRIRMGSAS